MFAVPPLPNLAEEAKAESGAADDMLPPPPLQQYDFNLDFLDQLGSGTNEKPTQEIKKKADIDFLTDMFPTNESKKEEECGLED